MRRALNVGGYGICLLVRAYPRPRRDSDL